MKISLSPPSLAAFLVLLTSSVPLTSVFAGQAKTLSPQDELKTFQVPDGYKMELVLSDPEIKEPVLAVFDGDGRMYVAEMRTYMQNIDGKGQLDAKSRISRHESTTYDGVYDKHSVYLDNLVLPRAILPLDDRVLVGVTNSNDITINRDTKHDGVADETKVWFTGGGRPGNLTAQPSGLVWGLDNWIYMTCNNYRLRWRGPTNPGRENTAPNGGQWGLAQDDFGKMWWSNAGNEKGLWNFQVPILYGAINSGGQRSDDFDMVWPSAGLGDVEAGADRYRPEDKTLNHFTACGGQTVYRGDRLPPELYENVFLPEPVGHFVRRVNVSVEDGISKMQNPYLKSEFLRSTDPNFRPVSVTTGPDGCLYIVDMYRGVIQEGEWLKDGTYLRSKIKDNGLQNNVGRGRIWRLTHKDFEPRPKPHMLEETPAQLVAHLEDPNGWWRDTAQRLLVLKGDKSVVPALTKMAESCKNPLGRLHAMWTLEGLNALAPEVVMHRLHDDHPMLRAGAIRAAESMLRRGNEALISEIFKMTSDSDPTVVLQVMMTSKLLNWSNWKKSAQDTIASSTSSGVKDIGNQLLQDLPGVPGKFETDERAHINHGQDIYRSMCYSCHGLDGKGIQAWGQNPMPIAPSLVGSKTVEQGDALIHVLLQGLAGPISGKTYETQMVSMGWNDDWIADATCYLRRAFGNQGALVTKDDVKRVREASKGRNKPWTNDEICACYPVPMGDRKQWKLTASANEKDTGKAVDGDGNSRWSSGAPQAAGMWFQIELPAVTDVAGVVLDCKAAASDYPRGYKVELSNDGSAWDPPILQGEGRNGVTDLQFPRTVKAKFIKITQTVDLKPNEGKSFWSINELQVLKPGAE